MLDSYPCLTDAEIEETRKKQLAKEDDDDENEDCGPSTLFHYEALHATSMMTNIVEQNLLNHPAILNNPTYYREAYKAYHNLCALHRILGLGALHRILGLNDKRPSSTKL